MNAIRYNSTRPVGSIVKDVLKNMGCMERFDEAKATDAWIELAGPGVNSVTRNVFVRKGVLVVEITSSAWRHELNMRRSQLCKELNKNLRKPLIREIAFR